MGKSFPRSFYYFFFMYLWRMANKILLHIPSLPFLGHGSSCHRRSSEESSSASLKRVRAAAASPRADDAEMGGAEAAAAANLNGAANGGGTACPAVPGDVGEGPPPVIYTQAR